MITDIENTKILNELNRDTLADYWEGYFRYQSNSVELYQLVNERLLEVIESEKNAARPFIDSQQVIGSILTVFGDHHNFHRQFSEQFPELRANQTLGMHLYDLIINDDTVWVYMETQHIGHMFPHATYFCLTNET